MHSIVAILYVVAEEGVTISLNDILIKAVAVTLQVGSRTIRRLSHYRDWFHVGYSTYTKTFA